MKRISVIIPCHNVASYIDRCMTSIIAQTVGIDSLEIICIDDASTDDTWMHLQGWEQLFPEDILLIRQEVSGGGNAAKDIGVQYASADRIVFIDAEDRIEPDHLERLYCPTEPSDRDAGPRVVMFYSGVESFNFFTDRLEEELRRRGYVVFICDLRDVEGKTEHSYKHLNRFISKKVDMVICFDGFGSQEDQFIQQWDKHQAVVVNILMDPPFRFHPTLEKHPKNYLLCCCDLEHVRYVERYFSKEVPSAMFLPHVGVLPQKDAGQIPYKERRYDLLFSGTYYTPQAQLSRVKDLFPDDPQKWDLYQRMFENMIADSTLTIEKALLRTIGQCGYIVSDQLLKTLLNRSVYVDWAIRMYFREKVVEILAGAGFELYLLGRGWEDHPSAGCPNVHRIDDRIPYGETLSYMADAKINLNVMPWFKEGTHDRIFNTLLQHSLPLTDPSAWITDHFTDGVDIALYDLKHLEELPGIVQSLLDDPDRVEGMIQKGYEKVSHNFTWSNLVDQLLEATKGSAK